LDLFKLSVDLFLKNKIEKIKYFTAIVNSWGDPNQVFRQKKYLEALETLYPKEIEIIKGHFTVHWKNYRIARKQEKNAKNDATEQSVYVIKPEEKGSDVNLAVHLVNDGWRGDYDVAIRVH